MRIASPDTVTVMQAAAADCGPISPVIAGMPSLDPSRRIVHLPIALHNGGEDQLHAPASLGARVGSVVTTASVPSPIREGRVPSYVGADPPRDSVGGNMLLARWFYDTLQPRVNASLVTAADGSIIVPSGATSVARSIDLTVPPGVTGFRVTLIGFGTYVLTVPARPPDTVPLDESRDARSPENLIMGDPRFAGRVARNRLWLLFRPSATAEQRQAAIEAVNGIIVGGTVRGTGNGYPPPHGSHVLRYYYVAFPAYPDSGAAPLERAIRTLAPLPQVQDVRPDVPDQD